MIFKFSSLATIVFAASSCFSAVCAQFAGKSISSSTVTVAPAPAASPTTPTPATNDNTDADGFEWEYYDDTASSSSISSTPTPNAEEVPSHLLRRSRRHGQVGQGQQLQKRSPLFEKINRAIDRTKNNGLQNKLQTQGKNTAAATVSIDFVLVQLQKRDSDKKILGDYKTLRTKVVALLPADTDSSFYGRFTSSEIVAACVTASASPENRKDIQKFLNVDTSLLNGQSKSQLVNICIEDLKKTNGGLFTTTGTNAPVNSSELNALPSLTGPATTNSVLSGPSVTNGDSSTISSITPGNQATSNLNIGPVTNNGGGGASTL